MNTETKESIARAQAIEAQVAPKIVERIESFINRFVTFSDRIYSLPIALWCLGTHVYPHFDAFPYLVITSPTKRSGKTRLMEIISFVSANPRSVAGMTAAGIFRLIQAEHPTLLVDEAETFSSEAASDKRAALNVGYRKGTSVPRMKGDKVELYDTYCPKIFVLIGDVYDTLKDRSIIVTMKRAEARERFLFEICKTEGESLRAEIAELFKQIPANDILGMYHNHAPLEFLTDRDEEIWTVLFTLCHLLAPRRLNELKACAVDIATEKTAESRKYIELLKDDNTEEAAMEHEYKERLLLDLYSLFLDGATKIPSTQAVELLKQIPTAPWRKFRGTGLDAKDLAYMLRQFNLGPDPIYLGGGRGDGPGRKNQNVCKGYKKEKVERAVKTLK
jgi:hypothetical protein